MTDKAQRAKIQLGPLEIEGFQMPDGSYQLSQTGAAYAVDLGRQNVSDFLGSKALKQLLGEDYTCQISSIEVETSSQSRGQARINALPLEAVNAYWHWQSHRGNKKALALCMALSGETLERRFDKVFGVDRSEAEYNQRLDGRLKGIEQQLTLLSDAYAEPDILREENERLKNQIRQLGQEPFAG